MKNNKSLGQHWLKNRAILDEIADLAQDGTNAETVCLEIGPGLGTLTSSLLKRFSKVIAVEFDERLATNLPKSFPNTNLEVIHDDILQVKLSAVLKTGNYVVVGNIPYYITSPIIRHLLNAAPSPRLIVLLIQKEVAERIAAEPSSHTFLSVVVQSQAEVKLGPVVKAAEFTPPPKVDSQVIILTPLQEKILSPEAVKLAKRGFSSPRKKLIHNLTGYGNTREAWQEILFKNGINPNARAQDLELIDWEELAKAME